MQGGGTAELLQSQMALTHLWYRVKWPSCVYTQDFIWHLLIGIGSESVSSGPHLSLLKDACAPHPVSFYLVSLSLLLPPRDLVLSIALLPTCCLSPWMERSGAGSLTVTFATVPYCQGWHVMCVRWAQVCVTC